MEGQRRLSRGASFAAVGRLAEDPWCIICFSLIGVGYLFPFCAMMQPVDYWHFLFPKFNILFQLTACYNYVNLIVLFLLVFLFPPQMTGTSFTYRITLGFCGQFLALIIIPSSYFLHQGEGTNHLIVLGATALMAIVTAFLDSSAISLGNLFPTAMQEKLQLGIGLSTLIGSVFRVFTKGVFPPESLVASSLAYFYSGAFAIFICLTSYFVLLTRPLSIHAFRRAHIQHPLHGWSFFTKLEQRFDGVGDGPEDPLIKATQEDGDGREVGIADDQSSSRKVVESLRTLPEFSTIELNKTQVVRAALPNHLLVAAMFGVTVAIWPGLLTELHSHQFPSLEKSGWWPLVLLLVFAISDVIGRFCVPWPMGINCNNVWIPILARVLVVPLIFLSVNETVPFLVHDAWSLAYVLFMGFSNGYIGTLSIIVVNQRLHHPQERRYAGSLTSFYLNAGLVLGASLGLVFERMIKPPS